MVPAWRIVALDASHIDDVIAIENTSFRQPWGRRSFINELTCGNALDFVVLEPHQGKIVAYTCLRRVRDETHLLRIAVAPAWRRRGVATWLLNRCIHSLRQTAPTVYLEVRRSNGAAISLYEKLGFRIIGTRPKYYEDNGEDALIMMKFLEEAQ